jgi:hypothetical protein
MSLEDWGIGVMGKKKEVEKIKRNYKLQIQT